MAKSSVMPLFRRRDSEAKLVQLVHDPLRGLCVNGADGRSSEVDVATSTLAAGLDEQIEATGRWRVRG